MLPRSGRILLCEMPIIIQLLTARRSLSNGGCLTWTVFEGRLLSLLELHPMLTNTYCARFFQEELGWSQSKVDDLLLPIIQKMNRRSHSTTANKQGNLNDFLGVMPGTGTHAPRQRQAYASKRLQQVVSEFRKKRARGRSAESVEESQAGEEGGEGEEQPEQGTKKRRKRKEGGGTTTKKRKQAAPKSSNGTRGKGKAKAKTSKPIEESDYGSDGAFSEGASGSVDIEVPLNVELRPRPKPRPLGRKPQPNGEQEAIPGDSG